MRRFFPSTIRDNASPPSVNYQFAYGTRKIVSSYVGNAIQVERSSDNTTLDIGFVGDDLDTSAISTFCGGSNGLVKRIYNQGLDGGFFDNQLANLALIYNGASFITVNGKPTIDFIGGLIRLKAIPTFNVTDSDSFSSTVIQHQPTSVLQGVWSERDDSAITRRNSVYSDTRTNKLFYGYGPNGVLITTVHDLRPSLNANVVMSVTKNGNNVDCYNNGVLQASNITTASATFGTVTGFDLGVQLSGSIYFQGKFMELVIDNVYDLTKMNNLITEQQTYWAI